MVDRSTSTNASPLSLERLTSAFAQMLEPSAIAPEEDLGEISLRGVVEAILFVGAEGELPHTAEQLAEAMRDVMPQEVEQAVEQLNAIYVRDQAPYEIARNSEGYRLQLRSEFDRMRDKFYGRFKEANLSPASLEVLSVVAYRQPTPLATIDQLRGVRSKSIVSQLVRRGLLRLERSDDSKGATTYRTTERFLRFFHLERLDQLPRAAELED